MMTPWPLIGRDQELEFIDAQLGPPRSGRGVVLAGAAGVGKTRLAREALAAWHRRGVATRWVAATASARELPLGAFAAIAGDLGRAPADLLRQAIDALARAAKDRNGLVIGVDDAHHLDDVSSSLLHQLVQRNTAAVILTLRTGHPAPDAVTALWKDGLLRRLELQSLSLDETAELVRLVLGGRLDSMAANRFWVMSGGNPLYLKLLVDGELEAGRLAQIASVWQWDGRPAVSAGLAELIGQRIGHLSQSQREVLEYLALSEPIGVSLLTGLTDQDAVEQVEARGLVEVYRDGRRLQAKLAHPLYSEVQRSKLGVLRASRLRGRVAEALAATGDRRAGDALHRALIELESNRAPGPQLLLAGANQAAERLDLELARRLARAAVEAGGGFGSRHALAMALSFLGRGAESEAEFAVLATMAQSTEELLRILLPRAANLLWALADPDSAMTVVDDAAPRISGPDAQAYLDATRAAIHGGTGRPRLAIAHARSALLNQSLDVIPQMLATMGLVQGLGGLGKADQIGQAAASCYQMARRSDTRIPVIALSYDHVVSLLLAGYLDQAETVAAERLEECAEVIGPERLLAVVEAGCVDLGKGRVRQARDRFAEAHAGLTGMPVPGWIMLCSLGMTKALALLGETGPARQAAAELAAQQNPAFSWREPEIRLARAWVAANEGAVSHAIQLAHQAAEFAAGHELYAQETNALHAAVCFGDRSVASQLTALAARVDGPRAPAAAAHAAALAAEDPTALLAASSRFEQIGDLLSAADAAAHAATAASQHRSRRQMTAALMHLERLASACDGVRTPALLAAARPLPLTDREREMVTLAAAGLTNKEIAGRLFVAVRTVEGHLYRAGAKLGTSDRKQFAALLRGD